MEPSVNCSVGVANRRAICEVCVRTASFSLWRLRTVMTSMRPAFRYAQGVPEEFWDQVNRTFVPSSAQRIHACTVAGWRDRPIC